MKKDSEQPRFFPAWVANCSAIAAFALFLAPDSGLIFGHQVPRTKGAKDMEAEKNFPDKISLDTILMAASNMIGSYQQQPYIKGAVNTAIALALEIELRQERSLRETRASASAA